MICREPHLVEEELDCWFNVRKDVLWAPVVKHEDCYAGYGGCCGANLAGQKCNLYAISMFPKCSGYEVEATLHVVSAPLNVLISSEVL